MGESWRNVLIHPPFPCLILTILIRNRYIIQEFVEGGELLEYVRESPEGRLPEDEAIRLFRQLLSGLTHCHQYQICHRDIKPENLLIDSNRNLKICDFGLGTIHYQDRLISQCGSVNYVAPEVANFEEYRGEISDIWSAGVVLFVMLAGRLPFTGTTTPADRSESLRDKICDAAVEWQPTTDNFSIEARDLLGCIFVVEPDERIPGPIIWRHRLIKKYDHYANDPRFADSWMGGPPVPLMSVDSGKPIKPETIDHDVIRTMCVLWHTGDEEDMLARVTSPM